MESQTMFLDCPAWLDEEGAVRCGLPAEVRSRFTMRSTGGPLESAMIRCPSGHWFNAPIEFLTLKDGKEPGPGSVGPAPGAGRGSRHGSPDRVERSLIISQLTAEAVLSPTEAGVQEGDSASRNCPILSACPRIAAAAGSARPYWTPWCRPQPIAKWFCGHYQLIMSSSREEREKRKCQCC
jgi:hypothetical protein